MVPWMRVTAGSMCRWLARKTGVTWPNHVWWIVNYHDVSSDARCPRPMVAPEAFEEQIDALRRVCRVVPLQEGFDRLSQNAIDGRFASITFDDGYAGVVEHAVPIMERLGVSGTVFVCGATLVEGRELWDIALLRLVQAGHAQEVSRLTGVDPATLAGPAAVTAVRREWSPALADALVRRASLLPGPGTARTMTMPEAAAADPARLRIGNHTWSHAVVSRLSQDQVIEEIWRTHEVIRGLPAFTPVFAYPFGEASDMSGEATRLARDCFGLHVVSAYGGFNRAGQRVSEDARRIGVNGSVQLPWDLVSSALRFTFAR